MLPEEQDKLLRELQYLEAKSPNEKGAEQGYIMFGLTVIATLAFLVISINDYFSNNANLLWVIFGVWAGFVISVYASFYGSKIGSAFATLVSITINLGLSYFLAKTFPNFMNLSLIADIFVIAMVTSIYIDKGYITSTILLVVKNVAVQFIFLSNVSYITLFVDTIIILVTGTFLLLIMYFFRMAENSRMQTLRAEILALQNQELIGSWEGFFKK